MQLTTRVSPLLAVAAFNIMQQTRAQEGFGLLTVLTWTIAGSSVYDNVAQKSCGGLYSTNLSRVAVISSTLYGNIAANGSGGGVLAAYNGAVTIFNSTLYGNTASKGGGGVHAQNVSEVLINSSTLHGNTARKHGGGVYASGDSWVTGTSSTLYGNTARLAGGGLCAILNATVTVKNSRILDNRALNGSGGGLLAVGQAVLTISDGCSIANNSCTGGVGGGAAAGISVEDLDKLQFGTMGRLSGDAALGWTGYDSTASVTVSGSSLTNNTSNRAGGGALAVVSRAVMSLVNGTSVVGNRAINGSGGAVMVMGSALFEADGTVTFAENNVPRGFVGSTIVVFDKADVSLPSHGPLTKCSGGVYLGRTPCGTGEVKQHDVCVCCPSHTFSFGNSSCTPCPPNAVCPRASIIEPMAGYWSSSPTSIQLHRCPL